MVHLSRNALRVTATLVFACQTSMLRAQEGTHEEGQDGRDNTVALFLGGVTHLGSDGEPSESGFAIGLEYLRRVSNRLRVGFLAEGSSTDVERDFIVAVQLLAHLTERFALVAAPGVEFASVEEGGQKEKETEFLMRFGMIYDIELNNWKLGPQVHADLVNGRWSLVYGIAFGIGF